MTRSPKPTYACLPAPVALIFGAPGSGKGTHATKLCSQFHLAHIATGDLFRQHLTSGTELGCKAKAFLDGGNLVPDEITIAMLRDRLLELATKEAAILDGFPRTIAQAKALDRLLQPIGRHVNAVIYLHVEDEEIVRRLTDRVVCQSCGQPANRTFRPPKVAGVCDHCGGELRQRADDNPDAVRLRLKVYHQQTQPLVDFYRVRGIVREIRGEIGPERVNAVAQFVLEKDFTRIEQIASPPPGGG